MAPPNTQKRTKGVSIFRPFVYGTTSHKFSEKYPKPEGTPDDHTHQWTVFVKGVDDSDITYWCRKVQFKLHESFPQNSRSEFLACLQLDRIWIGGAGVPSRARVTLGAFIEKHLFS